jgi:hypothetical protein
MGGRRRRTLLSMGVLVALLALVLNACAGGGNGGYEGSGQEE